MIRKISFGVALVFICIAILNWSYSAVTIQQPAPNPNNDAVTNQQDVNSEDNKESLKNWVALCAPCHSIHATGTEFGPPLLGPQAKRRFTAAQLVQLFANPEDHGLSEAAPALRKLTTPQREKLAGWLSNLKSPEDIVVESSTPLPAPFIFIQNCAGCHGPDARGGIGPNLHNVIKRRSREIIIKLIENPRNVGIKTKIMPSFEELSEEERSEIANWLVTLD